MRILRPINGTFCGSRTRTDVGVSAVERACSHRTTSGRLG
jgi:hypothetical protein